MYRPNGISGRFDITSDVPVLAHNLKARGVPQLQVYSLLYWCPPLLAIQRRDFPCNNMKRPLGSGIVYAIMQSWPSPRRSASGIERSAD